MRQGRRPALLEAHCDVRISVTHLNRVRAALAGATRKGEKSAGDMAGWCRWSPVVGRSRRQICSQQWRRPPHPGERVRAAPAGAGHYQNQTAVSADPAVPWCRGAAPPLGPGVYAQEGLALLTTRRRAYGYHTVERFLSQVVQAGGAEPLTDALARWTRLLWKPTGDETQPHSLTSYVDGHRKPVLGDELLPRGVIGRTGTILGCRALFLLHDEQGHPSLSTTHRGDLHLTLGTPSLITRYETATREGALRRLVIDREGMAAEFLATLAAEGRTVVTILRDSAVWRAGIVERRRGVSPPGA